MKTCSIVRDLLPLYIEKLTSDDTNDFVSTHLADCPACATLFAELTESLYVAQGQVPESSTSEQVVIGRIKRHILLSKLAFLAVGAILGIYATSKNQLQAPFLVYPLIGVAGQVLLGRIWAAPAVVFVLSSIGTLVFLDLHFGSIFLAGILAFLTLMGSLIAYCAKRVLE